MTRNLAWRLALSASLSFVVAVLLFGAWLDGYAQSSYPVALLGARGVARAPWFNVFGFVLPGLLAAWESWTLRERLPDDAHWAARIGAWLTLIAALAFAMQGVLPLDPDDLDAPGSRMHALAWTLWWVAFGAGAGLLAIGLCGDQGRRRLAAASVLAAIAVVGFGVVPWSSLTPAIGQRLAFVAWCAWLLGAARGITATR